MEDADQLADFVEEGAAQSATSSDWLNAVVPGWTAKTTPQTDDANEYARPTSASAKEFAWVSDIVEEETGEMSAVAPSEIEVTVYFRFKQAAGLADDAAGGTRGSRPGRRRRCPQPPNWILTRLTWMSSHLTITSTSTRQPTK